MEFKLKNHVYRLILSIWLGQTKKGLIKLGWLHKPFTDIRVKTKRWWLQVWWCKWRRQEWKCRRDDLIESLGIPVLFGLNTVSANDDRKNVYRARLDATIWFHFEGNIFWWYEKKPGAINTVTLAPFTVIFVFYWRLSLVEHIIEIITSNDRCY